MKLEKLEIELNRWGDNQGKYTGKISYTGPKGNVELLLDPEVSNEMLRHIGKTIIAFSTATAKQLESSIVESVNGAEAEKQIEA